VDKRQALEQWVRLRLLLRADDPLVAIIGAVARVADEGMDDAAAVQFVLEVLGDETPAAGRRTVALK
jgi:hypothetical protein